MKLVAVLLACLLAAFTTVAHAAEPPLATTDAGASLDAPAAAAAPPPETSTSEVDLDELAADLGGGESDGQSDEGQSKLRLFGFADFTYWRPLDQKSNSWLRYFPREDTFWVGNFNLYMSASLTDRIRTMGEVRFLYLPHGGWNPLTYDKSGVVVRPDDDINDPAEFGGTVRWGGIQIQRVWVEYELHYMLIARVGQFLTPYGIWNVDHGTPTIIGIQRPWIVREQLFPERQTGIELYGQRAMNSLTFGYHLTLSNGRGPADAFQDMNGNKAVGGRLYVDYRGDALVTVGGSFYYGRYTRLLERYLPPAPGVSIGGFEVKPIDQYDELALSADLRAEWRGFFLQSEFLLNERAYTDPGRLENRFVPGKFAPDIRRYGAYFLASYRLASLPLMPYARVDYLHLDNYYNAFSFGYDIGHMPNALSFYAGLNLRLVPSFVIKAEYVHTRFPGSADDSWGRDEVNALMFQTAWAF